LDPCLKWLSAWVELQLHRKLEKLLLLFLAWQSQQSPFLDVRNRPHIKAWVELLFIVETGDVVALCSRAEPIKKDIHTRKLPGRKKS
jgi:hypothetical protein